MPALDFFGYDKCSTCRKARQWLEQRGHALNVIDITQQPPEAATLRRILASGDYTLRQLFNTSGQLYRELNIKEKLPAMSEDQAIDLLAQHGKLIKRPIVTDGQRHTVGFSEDRYESVW